MKTMDDFLFIFKTQGFVLKALLACVGSQQSDTETDLAILQVLNRITKIPLVADVLIVRVGIITWLTGVINKVETWFFDTICALIDILVNLWFSVQQTRDSYSNPDQVEMQLMNLYFVMLPKLTVKISIESVDSFFQVLLWSTKSRFDMVSVETYRTLIDFSKMVLSEEQFGLLSKSEQQGQFTERGQQFLSRVMCKKEDGRNVVYKKVDSTDRILMYVRQFSINWQQSNIPQTNVS